MAKQHFKNQKSGFIFQPVLIFLVFSVFMTIGCNIDGSDSASDETKPSLISEADYEKYYEPFPNTLPSIDDASGPVADMQKALAAYELKNYEEADKIFKELPLTGVNQFYHALTALELGNNDYAVQRLKGVANNPKNPFQIPAKWYLGLISAKDGDLENARKMMQDVSKTGKYADLQKNATEILGILAKQGPIDTN